MKLRAHGHGYSPHDSGAVVVDWWSGGGLDVAGWNEITKLR